MLSAYFFLIFKAWRIMFQIQLGVCLILEKNASFISHFRRSFFACSFLVYTPINRQSFEQIWWAHVYGGVAHFISQGIPPPVPRPDICMRMNSSLLMVHVVSECVTQLQTLQSSFRTRQLWQRGLGRDDLYFYQISCWCVSLFQAKDGHIYCKYCVYIKQMCKV